MTKTTFATTEDHNAAMGTWHVIDASQYVLGKMAVAIAEILMGKNKPIYTPHVPVGDGVMCIASNFFRLPVLQSDIFGSVSFPLDLTSPPQAAGQITVGSTWSFQYWYRDPSSGVFGFNFSDALEASFCN